jgi:hypothetical protein
MADLDPNEHTIDELEAQLDDIDDPEALQEIREAEADGEDRSGALDTIDNRLNTVPNDEEDEGSAAGGVSENSAQTDRDAGGEGTSLVYLDLEGLFVDLLGVEIDLNEVELDVSSVPGSGNLLGNLLSEVAGLLDVDPSEALEQTLSQIDLKEMIPDAEIPSISDVIFGALNAFLDSLLEALEDRTEGSNSDSESSG